MQKIFAQTCVPIMPYYGGKSLQAQWVNQYLPRSAKAYIEAFAGSLAVGLARPAAVFEVVNDFDPGVANLYRVVQQRSAELSNVLRFTLQSRAEHECCRRVEKLRNDRQLPECPVEWARRHLILIRQSYTAKFAGSWGYVRQCSAGPFHRVVDLIPPVASRLRNAVVENLHFKDLIAKYSHLGRDCVWYLDPPYLPESRVSEQVYRCEMSLSEHELLMRLITQLDGMVVLSGYRSDLYDAALANWTRVEKVVPCHSARSDGRAKPIRTECLWINPQTIQRLIFERRLTQQQAA